MKRIESLRVVVVNKMVWICQSGPSGRRVRRGTECWVSLRSTQPTVVCDGKKVGARCPSHGLGFIGRERISIAVTIRFH